MSVSPWITFIPSLISLAILVAVIIFANKKMRFVESDEERHSKRRIAEFEIASGSTLAAARRAYENAVEQAAEMRAVVDELKRLEQQIRAERLRKPESEDET